MFRLVHTVFLLQKTFKICLFTCNYIISERSPVPPSGRARIRRVSIGVKDFAHKVRKESAKAAAAAGRRGNAGEVGRAHERRGRSGAVRDRRRGRALRASRLAPRAAAARDRVGRPLETRRR